MAKTRNVLSGLTNSLLLSIGQLCDDDYLAVFSKYKLRIYKQGRLILTGTQNWTDGLWNVVLPQCQQSIKVIIFRDKTKYELAEYLYKCAFSPSLVTFQKAINKGNLLPGRGLMTLILTNLSRIHYQRQKDT